LREHPITAAGTVRRSVLNYMYSVFMSLMQIRDVPDEVRTVLKARAASRGESLNAYLLGLLRREAARPTVEDVLERAARRSERASASALAAVSDARAERTPARGKGR
jgi:plasmid stability protein